MDSFPPDPTSDQFDRLPDSVILLVFNRIGDVKALGRCSAVSRRFQTLVPQVDDVTVRVDCVISDDDDPSPAFTVSDKSGHFSSLFRIFFTGLFKPFQSLTQLITPSSPSYECFGTEMEHRCVTHHSPTQVLKNFNEIRHLKIELPSGELGVHDGVLLKWKANFGSTLDNCVILGASSVVHSHECLQTNTENDNGSIPESFYTNGGLKLRVVWTISSLIAASARHYLLQPIISEHETLGSLVLTDADGQGVLSMNKAQLQELRVKPLSASSASKRTLVPALNMRLWYAPHVALPDGTVLNGATLVAIKPSDQWNKEVVESDDDWVASAFEEPYGTAVRMLLKRRTYCLEMNSF